MADKNFKESLDISEKYSRKLISGRVTATAGIRNPHTLALVYGEGANRIEVLRALEKQGKFRLAWYIIFSILSVVCLILEPKSWYLVIDLIMLYISLDLATQGNLVGMYMGTIECFLYAYIAFNNGLFGEIIKTLAIAVPLNIFTIVSWTKNIREQKRAKVSYKSKSEEESSGVVIRKLNKKHFWWMAIVYVVVLVGCFFGLRALKTNALILSTFVLTSMIFYKVLNGMRYKESWFFGIVLNLFGFAMWIQIIVQSSLSGSGMSFMELPPVISSIACLVNSFYGYNIWKSMYRKIAVNGGEILAKRKVSIKKIIKLRKQYQNLVWDKKVDIEKNS